MPTLSVTDANGDAVSAGSVTSPSTGVYRATISALANPTVIFAAFSGLVTGSATTLTFEYEVVGNFLFTEAAARAFQMSGSQTPLSSESAYPDAAIIEARDRITDQFEDATGKSWIKRYARLECQGNGSRVIYPDEGRAVASTGRQVGGSGRRVDIGSVLSCTIGGVSVTASNIKIVDGAFYRTDGYFTRWDTSDPLNVVIEYTYGDDPVDPEATLNGLRLLVADLVPSDVASWASSWSNEDGSFNRSDAGFAYPTKVWQWLKRVDRRTPVI